MASNDEVNAANAQDLQRAVTNVMSRHAATRPANTVKQYKNKQDDFAEWCSMKKFFDGSLVYESKLVEYLDSFVIARGNKRKRNEDGSPVALGYESVDAYVKAIIDLYQFQKSLGMNQHPHPRGKALKGLMDMLRRGENQRKLDTYADRGLGTVLDGYNMADMIALSKFWLKSGTGTALRTRVDFLVGHALLARGESRRFIQFPDMLSLTLSDEGPQTCTPLVVIMRKGKTNQTGRVEYGAAMRCKEVFVCPLNAVAFYFFWRWHIDLEPFPNLCDRKQWYDTRLLKGKNPSRDIAYNTQLESVKAAFAACGIDSSVWTHANRGSGAKMAELNGADEAQIRRAGRWNAERMESCYLTSLPRRAMRALAGFPTKGGGYWLARAAITPEPKLQSMVFPDLDTSEKTLQESSQREIAASGFITLLHELRVIFLQDSVILRLQYPNHRIWQEPLFDTPEYTSFETELLRSLPSAEQPLDQRIGAVIPLVASTLKSGFESLHCKIDGLTAEVAHLKKQRELVSKQRLVITLAGDTPPHLTSSTTPVGATGAEEVEGAATQQAVSPAATSQPVRLSRALTTVPEVWLEYTRGLSGQMSIKEAETRYGGRWRSNPTENRFFSRRKAYYTAIVTYASKFGVTEDAAAAELEEKRKEKNLSLNSFGKLVRQVVADIVTERIV